MTKKVIGIDLGTTTSCCSIFEGGKPVVIVNSEGRRTTPSVVGFGKDNERKVGDAAKRQAVTNPVNTISSIKRFMGETYDECKEEVGRVTYKVVNDNGYPKVDIDGRQYTPQEISSMILQKMKQTAEAYLGTEVKDAVITVPAYFSNNQKQATKEAGEIAGLNVLRIVNEPTAAALAYGLDKRDKDLKISVFDLGGGTFDVSVLDFGDGVFEVLSTNGDTHLGGDDFDQIIVKWMVDTFKEDENFDLTKDKMALQRLKEAAEKAKIELSSSLSTEINLPYITAIDGVPKHFVKTLTRAKFEELSDKLIERCKKPCYEALEAAHLKPEDIDEVILVGGSTRIPAIQSLAKAVFGKEPSKSINPDEAVSLGAAIQGAILTREEGADDIVLLDITPISMGIETAGGVFTKLIEGNTTIPCKKSQIFTTAEDNQSGVEIRVLQGERPMANDNKDVGLFRLDGIMPAPRGIPQIEVTFNIDANGILKVTAVDKATQKEQSITIEGGTSLSSEEVERIKAEAKKFEAEDKKRREEVDALNTAESTVFSSRKLIEEQKDKLSEDETKTLNEKIDELEKAVKDKDAAKAKTLTSEVNVEFGRIAAKLYQQNGQSGQTSGFNPNDIFNAAKQ